MQPLEDREIFNPSELEEDAFLAGPDRHEAFEDGKIDDLLDVDDVFGKSLERILGDQCPDGLDPASAFTPSLVKKGYMFAEVESGVVLFAPGGELAGAYLGTDLVVSPEHQGLGLGAELVLEYAMRNGCLPNWWLDSAAYSRAGEAAHRSAWRMSLDEGFFLRKAALLQEAIREADMEHCAPEGAPS